MFTRMMRDVAHRGGVAKVMKTMVEHDHRIDGVERRVCHVKADLKADLKELKAQVFRAAEVWDRTPTVAEHGCWDRTPHGRAWVRRAPPMDYPASQPKLASIRERRSPCGEAHKTPGEAAPESLDAVRARQPRRPHQVA